MQLRNRFYPYPVIMEDGESYIDSVFSNEVEQAMDGFNIKLTLKSTLVNPELQKMVEDGIVEIVHHIECPKTCYRKIIRTKEYAETYIVKNTDVNDLVEICSFLVAKQDIPKYSNSNFANEYKGFKFDLDRGCILAIGSQINVRVNKIRDDLANTASIFSVVPNTDPNAMEYSVDLNEHKIVIMLPEKSYQKYAGVKSYMEVQPVMHSMLIVPALMYVLSELKQYKHALYEYEERRWFRSLYKVCEGMGINLDESHIDNVDICAVSQKLINSPIINAVDFAVAGGGIDED